MLSVILTLCEISKKKVLDLELEFQGTGKGNALFTCSYQFVPSKDFVFIGHGRIIIKEPSSHLDFGALQVNKWQSMNHRKQKSFLLTLFLKRHIFNILASLTDLSEEMTSPKKMLWWKIYFVDLQTNALILTIVSYYFLLISIRKIASRSIYL